jgi:hypothetical protein
MNKMEKGFMSSINKDTIHPAKHAVAIDEKTNEVLYNVPVTSEAQKAILEQKAQEAGNVDLNFLATKKGADDVIASIKETNQ